MKSSATSLCYILPNGATQEAALSWQELKRRVETGELAPDTLMYREESQRWVAIASLSEFKDVVWNHAAESGTSEESAEESADLLELQEEYDRTVREARDQYDSFECLTKAARMALSLNKRDEAVAHYQRALELQPFNKRLSTEIKRSFSPVVYRTISLLDRPPSFWEDPISSLTYPAQIRKVPFAIATAALAAALLVPHAQPLFWFVLALLGVRVSIEASQKSIVPPDGLMTDIEPFLCNWKSAASFVLCGAAFLLPFAILSELALLFGRAGHWNFFQFIQNSPLMTVAIFLAGAAILPAALMVSTNKEQKLRDIFALKRIMRLIAEDDREYLLLVAGISAIALVWLGLRAFFSFIPVVGEIIAAAAGLYGVLLIGFITGRTRSRHEHLF